MERGSCRGCGAPLQQVFADLGMTPLANSFLTEDQLGASEPSYPLRAMVCATCFLVQLEEFEALAAPPFEDRGRVTDEYLKIIAAHGGGYLPSYAPRSDHACFVSPANCNPEIKLKKK